MQCNITLEGKRKFILDVLVMSLGCKRNRFGKPAVSGTIFTAIHECCFVLFCFPVGG
jgi:hypothetical protein